ncbi:MAG: hypothetical protein IPJ41_16660 [Phycisphaerales bacterium]|nr:hypothetical protein [Phycisphaerales bacterium]
MPLRPKARAGLLALVVALGALWLSIVPALPAPAAILAGSLALLVAGGLFLADARDAERASEAERRRLALEADARRAERDTEREALRAILDAVEQPVVALDAAGFLTVANRSAAALLAPGSSRPLTGAPLDQILPDEPILAIVRAAADQGLTRGQVRLLTASGPRILEVQAEAYPGGPRGPAIVLSLRDVTEQATALQLKTDFVANASHELRTPLTSIKAAAETLDQIGDESPEIRRRLISLIGSNAERLEELARDLLDLSSLESPGADCLPEHVDLFEIAEQLREMFHPIAEQRRISIRLELDERLHELWTDPRLVRLVLRNLLDNAIKFAYDDTSVLVRGTVVEAGAAQRLDTRIDVIDRGIGIPIALQQRIFERFFQADAARSGSKSRGTGLGLAIVKHALRALGGSIQVASVWQQGTTMTVLLPASVELATTESG